MKAGPKPVKAGLYPTDHLPDDGPERVLAFLAGLESRTGQLRLRPFQEEIIRGLYERPRPRQALVQMGRQNGKSQLAAWLGLYALVADKAKNPVVGIIANSERQAQEVFRKALDVVEFDDRLQAVVNVYHDRVEYPGAGTRLQVFASSPAGAKGGGGRQVRGISAHLMIVDELAFTPDPDLWYSVLLPTILADEDAYLLAITSPGYDFDGPAHQMYVRAKAGDTERFYARIFEPTNPQADIEDESAWAEANPALGGGVSIEDLRIARKNVPEHVFRREHMGQWTATSDAWLPYGAWEACRHPAGRGAPEAGTRVWLGFDGSYSGDSTALVGVTEDRHIFVAGCWENPGQTGWRVPRDDVEAAIWSAFEQWEVVELLCDPPYWGREIHEWQKVWGEKRVLEFPTYNRGRMAPATTSLAAAVLDQALTHDGDTRLERHVANCVVKPTPQGDVITKVHKDSAAKIDLAVAAAMAFHQAVTAPARRARIFVV